MFLETFFSGNPFAPNQAHDDYKPELLRLREAGTTAEATEELARMEESLEAWADSVEHSRPATRAQKRGADGKKKGHVYHRTKSYQALLERDNSLRGADGTGPGLARWLALSVGRTCPRAGATLEH